MSDPGEATTVARYRIPLTGGADRLADGRTRFSLWAPSLASVQLELEGHIPEDMLVMGEGWFRLERSSAPDARYRYRLPDGSTVPDPVARAQHGGVEGWSGVLDPQDYAWVHHEWIGRPWTEAVIYELHLGLAGGYAGALRWLPELARLGVTVVELMPIAEFAGARNWGYDGVLPYAPASAYGTPAELKHFIDTAHGLGLCVMLDVVYNHFGPAGNHLAQYAQPFFAEGRDSPWGAAIDFANPMVRQFFIENALYWLLEYRFDGLRLDAVHAIGDTAFLRELAGIVRHRVEPERHIHLVLENEHNEASLLRTSEHRDHYDAQWNDDFHNALHVALTGEREGYYAAYAPEPMPLLLRALREGFSWQGEPMPTRADRAPRGEPSADLPPTAFVSFLQNHDQVGNRALGERLGALVAPRALAAAQALLLLSPQTPLIFMGEEHDGAPPFRFFTDFEEPLATAVREGRRKEFAAFAAFADERSRARIPDPNASATFEACRLPPPDAASPAGQRLRRLLELRARQLRPWLGQARALDVLSLGGEAFRARWRLGESGILRISCNLGAASLRCEPAPPAELLHESRPGAAQQLAEGLLMGHTTVVEREAAHERTGT